MKVLICGGRDLNEKLVCTWLENNFLTLFPDCTMIVHGGAKGADNGAHKFCVKENFPETVYAVSKEEWNKYGRAAGVLRNQKMLDQENPDIILAFPGGRGTKDMIIRGKKNKLIVYEIKTFYKNNDMFEM